MSLNTIAWTGVLAILFGLYLIVTRLDRIIALQQHYRGCLDQITASLGILSRQVEETNRRIQAATEHRPDADPALDEAMQRFAEDVGETLHKPR